MPRAALLFFDLAGVPIMRAISAATAVSISEVEAATYIAEETTSESRGERHQSLVGKGEAGCNRIVMKVAQLGAKQSVLGLSMGRGTLVTNRDQQVQLFWLLLHRAKELMIPFVQRDACQQFSQALA